MMHKLRQFLAERRAVANIARLYSGEMTGAQERAFSNWRRESKEYQFGFTSTNQVIDDLSVLEHDADLLALVDEPAVPQFTQKITQQKQWFLPVAAIAAAVMLAAAIGVYFFEREPVEGGDSNVLRYVTRTGEQKAVNLSDGSVIKLNTATRLLVDMTDHSRHVILERGEAYFDVVSDPERPFIVNLGGRSVSVLGTEFNILKSPDKFTLAVIEGSVAIHRQDENALAAAPLVNVGNEPKAQINSGGQRRVEAGIVAEFDVDSQRLLAWKPKNINKLVGWRSGVLGFDEEPLYKVIQELNRYSAKKILIEDKSIMDLQVFATVRLDQLNTALMGFEQTMPIKVISYVDRVVLVGSENN